MEFLRCAFPYGYSEYHSFVKMCCHTNCTHMAFLWCGSLPGFLDHHILQMLYQINCGFAPMLALISECRVYYVEMLQIALVWSFLSVDSSMGIQIICTWTC